MCPSASVLVRSKKAPDAVETPGLAKAKKSLLACARDPVGDRLTDRKRGERRFGMDVVGLIYPVLPPPAGVFLQVGFGSRFWQTILLTVLGYVPGAVPAAYIIFTRD